MVIFCHTGLQFDLIPTHWCDSLHCPKEIGENAARNRKKVFFYFRDNRTENNGCIKFCLLSKNTSSHCLTGNQNSNHQSIGKYLKISFLKSICISLPATLIQWYYPRVVSPLFRQIFTEKREFWLFLGLKWTHFSRYPVHPLKNCKHF